MNYIVFSQSSGEIIKSGICPDSEDALSQASEGQGVLLELGSDEGQYIDLSDKSVQPKIDNPATLSGTTLSNLPLPCTVTMRGPTQAEAYVEQGDLTLDADVPGQYTVIIVADHPKYYDAEFEVDL